MAFPQKYQGACEVAFNSSVLAEAKTVSIELTNNSKREVTMAKGFAGSALGPVMNEITVDSAVPLVGLEADFIAACVVTATVQITVAYAGKRYTFNAVIESVSLKAGAEEASLISFKAVAGPATAL